MLALAGLDHAFSCVVTGEDAPAGKPSPALYRVALERLSRLRATPPSVCVALEDTLVGIRAARGRWPRAVAVGALPGIWPWKRRLVPQIADLPCRAGATWRETASVSMTSLGAVRRIQAIRRYSREYRHCAQRRRIRTWRRSRGDLRARRHNATGLSQTKYRDGSGPGQYAAASHERKITTECASSASEDCSSSLPARPLRRVGGDGAQVSNTRSRVTPTVKEYEREACTAAGE